MTATSPGKIIHSLPPLLFPLLHAFICMPLLGWIAGFFYLDNSKAFLWGAIGFAWGLVSAIAIQWWLRKFLSRHSKFIRFTSLSCIVLFEIALSIFFIGPSIWLFINFTPRDNQHSICCETPLDYGATRYNNIRITTGDGATIAGWYVAPTTQAGKVIILIHGYGYDRRGTDFQTRLLLAAGYGVLLYDLRNHGESSGKINVFNRMEIYQSDLSQVVNYLKQKPEVNPGKIAVVGISLGAFTTLNSSTETLNDFAALWLDGLRFENFFAQEPVHTLKGFTDALIDRQVRRLAGIFYQQPITPAPPLFTQIIAQIKRPPLMLVASGLDEGERQLNEKFIPLMGGNKSIWFIDNAWHIGGRFEVPQEYGDKMLDFFARALAD
ncbi:MAG TPA: alpha/beta fold hydrolase [Cellvibrio sp.]|nr:alpha/beta fold hydrolase [Cellvibrio sp.]